MTITAEQAAKLLEGTTPGPWEASPHQWPEQVGCCPLVGRPYSAAHKMRNVAAANTAPDIQLIAAAPDLARALIASEAARKLAEERLAKSVYSRTGVKDQDGREICVGDRILIDLSSPHTKKEYWRPEYEVVFKPPHFALKHVGGDKDSDTAHFYWNVPQPSSTKKIVTLSIKEIDNG